MSSLLNQSEQRVSSLLDEEVQQPNASQFDNMVEKLEEEVPMQFEQNVIPVEVEIIKPEEKEEEKVEEKVEEVKPDVEEEKENQMSDDDRMK
jgi:hypothetical protein